jgi:3-deoxy-D-manno-octulosonate 8-phosphate phosphatase (KDO 8-P phosphatase)
MIKHLVLDIDGVLTDGKFYYSAEGKVLKAFGVHDKDGIKIALALGLTVDFITADSSGFDIVRARLVRDWDIPDENVILVGDVNRLDWIASKYPIDQVAYMGDGIYDAAALCKVKLGIAPKNARIEARRAANYITPSDAGNGAVLDACLHIKGILNGSI